MEGGGDGDLGGLRPPPEVLVCAWRLLTGAAPRPLCLAGEENTQTKNTSPEAPRPTTEEADPRRRTEKDGGDLYQEAAESFGLLFELQDRYFRTDNQGGGALQPST